MDRVSLRRRVCVVCSEPIVERGRIDRMYCSAGCRSLAWKERKRSMGAAGQPAPHAAAPPASYADYAPHGTLVQLAQRLESDRLSAQRELAEAYRERAAMQRQLAAAHQRIAELERDGREGGSTTTQQQENNSPALRPHAAQAAHKELQCQPLDAPRAKNDVAPTAQATELSMGPTADGQRTETEPHATVAPKNTAAPIARLLVEHAVESMKVALRTDGPQAEVFECLLSSEHDRLSEVAVYIAQEVKRMAEEGETDHGVAAACALDWSRHRLLSKTPESLAQKLWVLFTKHRHIFIQFAEFVAARVMSASHALRDVSATHRPWFHIAQAVLNRFLDQDGQFLGTQTGLSGWESTSWEILRDLCRAIVERIRFAASRKNDVKVSILASYGLADIAWRHFDEGTAIKRWLVENHSALEKLTGELTEYIPKGAGYAALVRALC